MLGVFYKFLSIRLEVLGGGLWEEDGGYWEMVRIGEVNE